MSPNHPRHEEGVVFVEIAEITKEAEKKREPWPELDEPTFDEVPSLEHARFAERVMWTMVALIGAVTVYGIATGSREILMAVLAIAAGGLLRLAGIEPEKKQKGEKQSHGRAKGPPKKRGHPGGPRQDQDDG